MTREETVGTILSVEVEPSPKVDSSGSFSSFSLSSVFKTMI
jgi:hypothetical protein